MGRGSIQPGSLVGLIEVLLRAAAMILDLCIPTIVIFIPGVDLGRYFTDTIYGPS